MYAEDFLAQQPNLHKACETIRGKAIQPWTWARWEKLVGACYPQGKDLKNRKYTDEQTQLFICLAWMRRLFPGVEITYQSLRDFWKSNDYKVEEALDKICNPPPPQDEPEVKLLDLNEVKKYCDAVAGHIIPSNSWANRKQHLGIPKGAKQVEEGQAALLVFMCCWRRDNPNKPFPSVSRLQVLMEYSHQPQLTLDTASSYKVRHQWEIEGCPGKDLARYLTAQGYKVALCTLYQWGNNFSKRKHYSVSELAEWRRIAAQRRRCA